MNECGGRQRTVGKWPTYEWFRVLYYRCDKTIAVSYPFGSSEQTGSES